jgi:hypothetical protein
MARIITNSMSKIDEGEYDATIINIADKDNIETKQFGIRSFYSMTFRVEDANGTNVEIIKDFNKTLNDKSNLYALIKALDSEHFDGKRYDVDGLLGKNCRVEVIHKTSATSGAEYDKIERVLRPRASSSKQPASLEELADLND